MTTVGIVAEYNPFHRGHALHIQKVREKYGEDTAIVLAISGDFVQRGEASAFSKFARAEAAVRGGASLVLEIPLPWCIASAEGFARGGIGVLFNTGVTDVVSFGSECGDAMLLRECARTVEREDFGERLRAELKKGVSFATARQRIVAAMAGEETASVLSAPNDTLGVEYIRAAHSIRWSPGFFAPKREGPQHDRQGSASELRSRLRAGENILPELPENVSPVFERELREERCPLLSNRMDTILMTLLRSATPAAFAKAPDTGEGLHNALYTAAVEEATPEDVAMGAKSKRYTLARIRRALLCTALGVESGMNEGIPPYLRVLAMDEKGKALLRRMNDTCPVPVIIKSSAVRGQEKTVSDLFALGSRAHDLYVLNYGKPNDRLGGEDYRYSPYILPMEREFG